MDQVREEVVACERRFWDKSNDPEFFEEAVAEDSITVFEPMGFIGKGQAVEMSKAGEAWTDVEMQDVKTVDVAPDVVAVLYHARAKKAESGEPYSGSIASVYAKRDGDWKLVLSVHQPWDAEASKKAA